MLDWIKEHPEVVIEIAAAICGAFGITVAALVKYARTAREVATTVVDQLERGKRVEGTAGGVIARIQEKYEDMAPSRKDFLADVVAAVKDRPRENVGKRIGKVVGRALLGAFLKRLG